MRNNAHMHNENNHGIQLVQHSSSSSSSSSSNQLKPPLAAAAFVACKARRARRVLLEPAVHSRCAGHGHSRRGSSTSSLCTTAAGRARALVGWVVYGQVRGLEYRAQAIFSRRETGLGNKGQFGLICVFFVTRRFFWSYL